MQSDLTVSFSVCSYKESCQRCSLSHLLVSLETTDELRLRNLLQIENTAVKPGLPVCTGMIGCGLAMNFEQLLVARWITGIGSALQNTGAQLFLADISTPSNRAQSLGTNQARHCHQLLTLSTNFRWRSGVQLLISLLAQFQQGLRRKSEHSEDTN